MEIKFDCANMSTKEAAEALGTSEQTVRVLIQQGCVDWGMCTKISPHSQHYKYFISPLKFYEATGYYKTNDT